MREKTLANNITEIFRGAIFVRIVAITFSDITSIVFAIVLGNTTTAVINRTMVSEREVHVFIFLLIMVVLIKPFLLYVSNKIILRQSIEGDSFIFKKILNQQPETIQRNNPGELSSKIIDDGIQLRWAIIDIFVYSWELIVMFAVWLLFMKEIHFEYACFILCLVLVNWIKSKISSNVLTKYKVKYMSFEQEINNSLYENMKIVDYLFVNKFTHLAIKKISKKIDVLVDSILRKKRGLEGFFSLVNSFFDNCTYILIILFGMSLVKRYCIEIGVVITMSYYYNILSKQFANIDNIRQAKDMKVEMEREINNLISESKMVVPTRFETLRVGPLEFNNNGFRLVYNEKIEIKKGDKIAIIGENGTGKTTLLYLLTGVYKCNKGEILLNGEFMDSAKLRSFISYIDVDAEMFNDIVQEYIFANVNYKEEAEKIIEEFKLTGFLVNSSEELSGGERRRTDLARIVMEKRDIIAMDEPEVYLDCHWKEKVVELLSQKEKTVIFTSHDPWLIGKANKIIRV